MTDPDIGLDTQPQYAAPAAWADNNCGEIGDICDTNGIGDTITVRSLRLGLRGPRRLPPRRRAPFAEAPSRRILR